MAFLLTHSYLIPLFPLLGAIVAGLFGAKFLRGRTHWPIWIGVGTSAVLSIFLLFGLLGSTPGPEGTVPQRADVTHTASLGDAHLGDAVHGPVATSGRVAYHSHWFTWIRAGDPATAGEPGGLFHVAAAAFIDPLTGVMLTVVCGIGFLITVFAKGYMAGEAGYWRFFSYLGLFLFAMTCLVMGDNLILLYLGWEGVGLCSYLLIGYYYDRPAAREAAKKAFLVNRVGDFGFAIGIMLVFYCFGTVSYFGDGTAGSVGFVEMALNPAAYVPADRLHLVDYIPFALMLGAFGKSAQFPLYVWLPDAMEGPTPVSALIHAATMVTAGVYMIARLSTLFVANEAAMVTIAFVGAFTALFAGSIALRQFDLKKVFAYSTVSQLGFMFVGVAVLAPVAAVFHLVTHAFFKALLFLASGVVMHAMMGHLDLRKMSGLKRVLPKTRVMALVGCAALAGFPLVTAGYWSKDEIIHYAGYKSLLLQLVLLLTAFMTAYYTFRVYFRVFEGPTVVPDGPADAHPAGAEPSDPHSMGAQADPHGAASHSAVVTGTEHLSGVDRAAAHLPPNADGHNHAHGHENHGHHDHEPLVMMWPLAVLAIGAVLAGFLNTPFWHGLGHFLGHSPSFSLGYAKAVLAYPVVDPVPFGQPGGHGGFPFLGLFIGGVVALGGIGTAYLFHLKDRTTAERIAGRLSGLSRAMEAKYWVDEVYQTTIVEPLRALGRGLFLFDRYVVDGLVWLVSFIPQLGGFALKLTTQRGHLQGYATAMLFGVAVLLLLVLR